MFPYFDEKILMITYRLLRPLLTQRCGLIRPHADWYRLSDERYPVDKTQPVSFGRPNARASLVRVKNYKYGAHAQPNRRDAVDEPE